MIFLHGLPETSYAWRRQFNWLAADHRVLSIDLEGFGRSRSTAEDYSIDAMATRLLALLDALEVDRFTLVGHDWGGMIGARLASQAAARVTGYVHVAAPLQRYDISRIPDLRDFRRDPGSIPDLLRNPEIFVRRLYQLGLSRGSDSLPDGLVDRYTAALANSASQRALAEYFVQLDVGADWRLGPRSAPVWSQVTAPVLFVLGGRDLWLPLEEFDDIEAQVPTLVALAVVEGAGHYPHEEDPPRFGDLLHEFLRDR